MLRTSRTALLVVAAPLALLACGGEEPPPNPPPTTAGLPTPPPVDTTPPPTTASAASTATTPPPPPEIPWKDLYDLDNPPTPHVATKDDDKILTKAIGAHKKTQADCHGAKTGTVATISDDAIGAFTGKGQSETAYTLRLSPCGATDDTQDKFKLIVVGADGKVSRNVDVTEQWIAGTSDIDSDGDNEILLVGTNSQGGVSTNTARLVELTDASKLQIIYDWHEITRSTCNGTPDDKAESAKIQYRVNASGGMDFQAAKKPGTCPKK